MPPNGKMTRVEVARYCAVSVATVRRLEGKKLFPRKDCRGVHVFERDEVVAFERSRDNRTPAQRTDRPPALEDPDLSVRAMDLFEAGGTVVDAVRALRIACVDAERLWAFYCQGSTRAPEVGSGVVERPQRALASEAR